MQAFFLYAFAFLSLHLPIHSIESAPRISDLGMVLVYLTFRLSLYMYGCYPEHMYLYVCEQQRQRTTHPVYSIQRHKVRMPDRNCSMVSGIYVLTWKEKCFALIMSKVNT